MLKGKTIRLVILNNNLWCVYEKEKKSSVSKLIKFGQLIVEESSMSHFEDLFSAINNFYD